LQSTSLSRAPVSVLLVPQVIFMALKVPLTHRTCVHDLFPIAIARRRAISSDNALSQQVVIKTLMGDYVEAGNNHGRKVKPPVVQKGGATYWIDKLEDVNINSRRLVAAYSTASKQTLDVAKPVTRSTGKPASAKKRACSAEGTTKASRLSVSSVSSGSTTGKRETSVEDSGVRLRNEWLRTVGAYIHKEIVLDSFFVGDDMVDPEVSLQLSDVTDTTACSQCSTPESFDSASAHGNTIEEGTLTNCNSTSSIHNEEDPTQDPKLSRHAGSDCSTAEFSESPSVQEESEGVATETPAGSDCDCGTAEFSESQSVQEESEGVATETPAGSDCGTAEFSESQSVQEESEGVSASTCCSTLPSPRSSEPQMLPEPWSARSCVTKSSAASPKKFVSYKLEESDDDSASEHEECEDSASEHEESEENAASPQSHVFAEPLSARSTKSSVASPKKYVSFKVAGPLSARSECSSVASPRKFVSFRISGPRSARSDSSAGASPKKYVSFRVADPLSARSGSSSVQSPRRYQSYTIAEQLSPSCCCRSELSPRSDTTNADDEQELKALSTGPAWAHFFCR